jgi:hypothetical protein
MAYLDFHEIAKRLQQWKAYQARYINPATGASFPMFPAEPPSRPAPPPAQ